MKLLYKLFLGFLFVAAMSWIIGYFSVNHSKEILEMVFIDNSETLARGIAKGIEENILNTITIFREFSQNTLTQNTLATSNKDFEKLPDIQAYILQKDRAWISSQKREITPFMDNLINNDLSRELRRKIQFYEKEAGHQVSGEIFVTNQYGANVAQTGKTSDYRQDDEDWWITTKKNGHYLSNVQYDDSAELYSLDLGLRIDDRDGNFIGTVKIVINFQSIINIIREEKPSGIHKDYKTMSFKIIDKQGRLIFSTKEFDFLEDASHLLPADNQLRDHEHPVISSKRGKIDREQSETTLVTHAHIKGLKDFNLPEWFLIAEHGSEELFAPVTALKNKVMVISATITVVSLLIGFFVSFPIVRNVKKLMAAASSIGKGDFNARIEVNSKDEIGKLAASLKQMKEELKSSEAQLIQSEKLSAIGKLSAGLAHELSSPLEGLSSLIKVQRTRVEKKDSKEYHHLTLMLKSCEYMAKIIRDFSVFSRRSDAVFEEIDANKTIDESLVLVRSSLKQKNIELIKEYTRDIQKVRGKKTELQQVILNIIMNAIDAMDNSGRLVIRTGLTLKQNMIVMEFQDNGSGIQSEVINKIFDPFYTTKDPGSGTGLGLSVSYGIIRNHGGDIRAESRVGEGSTFSVFLPVAEA